MINDDDFATVTRKIKNREYTISTRKELDALPGFESLSEDDDNYGRELEYRDKFLEEREASSSEKNKKDNADKSIILNGEEHFEENLEKWVSLVDEYRKANKRE